MPDPRFFTRQGPFTLSQIAQASGAALAEATDGARLITDVAPLDSAAAGELSFLDNPKYRDAFRASRAGACFVRPDMAAQAPATMACLICDDPYRAYALAAQAFYPAHRPSPGIHPSAHIAPTAVLGEDVCIEAGAVIGAHAEIAARCHIGANAVIGDGVMIGEGSVIGPLCSLSHCLIGTQVILHRGVQVGQDGFGFAMSAKGHVKVPQLGRVMIEDHVEIGSNATIDRGAGPDTVIGAGSKIDNLVQIGHNVVIGKGCIIVAQTGVSGSTRLGQGVVLAGQSGIAGHLVIGAGARVAAQSGVMADIPAGHSVGGSPAVPIRDWHRQTLALAGLIKRKKDEAKS